MITYHTARKPGDLLVVRLDKKVAGVIRRDDTGFYYAPTGASKKHRGETFPTLEAVKRSIEGN